jgi:hypothetical protein
MHSIGVHDMKWDLHWIKPWLREGHGALSQDDLPIEPIISPVLSSRYPVSSTKATVRNRLRRP